MGWAGIQNGALLAQAASQGFDALLTKDTNLQYQQNLKTLLISVVVLHAETFDIEDLRPLIPKLLQTLERLSEATDASVKLEL